LHDVIEDDEVANEPVDASERDDVELSSVRIPPQPVEPGPVVERVAHSV
jgi:hypothetical protein